MFTWSVFHYCSRFAHVRLSPALPDLAGGENSAVNRVEGKERVGRTRPLELLVPEVPVVRILHENTAQRSVGPTTLGKEDTGGYSCGLLPPPIPGSPAVQLGTQAHVAGVCSAAPQ